MTIGKKVPASEDAASVEKALVSGDWPQVRYAMAVKLAHMFDQTESARDAKAISVSLAPLVAACEADRVLSGKDDSELSRILAEAEKLRGADDKKTMHS